MNDPFLITLWRRMCTSWFWPSAPDHNASVCKSLSWKIGVMADERGIRLKEHSASIRWTMMGQAMQQTTATESGDSKEFLTWFSLQEHAATWLSCKTLSMDSTVQAEDSHNFRQRSLTWTENLSNEIYKSKTSCTRIWCRHPFWQNYIETSNLILYFCHNKQSHDEIWCVMQL